MRRRELDTIRPVDHDGEVLGVIEFQIARGPLALLSLDTVNAFIEDTCVLATIAYTIGRGPLLSRLFQEPKDTRARLMLGTLFGLLACTEALFPGARAPYVTSTAMISLAAVAGDIWIACIATGIALAGFLARGSFAALLPTAACCAMACTVATVIRDSVPRRIFISGVFAGALGQAGAFGVRIAEHAPQSANWASIPANAVGVAIILAILGDARVRERSKANEMAFERSQTLMRDAQLKDLRSRIHPHFIFNALTSIAALCRTDNRAAERSVVALATILRRALETHGADQIPLSAEIAHVKSYLEIEQLRWGERLHTAWTIDDSALGYEVPAFALQTLVENSIIHSSPHVEKLDVRISVQRRSERTVVSVLDNGPGFSRRPDLEEDHPSHGLSITDRRLRLFGGRSSRLRIFTKPGDGSLVLFSVPYGHGC